MAAKHALNVFLLCALSGGFLVGLVLLLDEDIALGNGYAAYSSFRADPSGAKALFESLERVPELKVTRNFREAALWRDRGVTLLVLGISEAEMVHQSNDALAEWERMADGNRIVLAVEPSTFLTKPSKSAFASRWGLSLATPAEKAPAWRRFFGRTTGWTEGESDEGKPVVLEKRFGEGSIVLVADSRVFTNQALADDHRSSFLSRIIGAYSRVQFDEAHLGIEESGGVMVLARKYQLEGLLCGLALLALLFFWKEGAAFPTPRPETATTQATGQGSLEGFSGLLRTHLASSRLMEECLTQWRRTNPGNSKFDQVRVAVASEPNPLLAYARIRGIIDKTHE